MSESANALEGPERLIGSRVLDFELKSVIGAGGMSVVYRGQHRVTQQEVAIKILPPELAVHEELKARFVEEARVLARLEHPNIVHLNNFTEASGRLCLVMQFVEGVTFESKIVQQGKVAPDEALRVGIEVCRALEYAHAQGVVHRDIKPSNILVRSDGGVKVTDFGIAKFVGASRLTSTGQTMGTVRYMSPEQVRGKGADARSDIYSLGITLYEALAGQTPFDGENHFDIMQQHLRNRPPPLSKLGALVPPSVEKALLAALEKNAADRYPDAAAFRQALERVLPELPRGTDATVAAPRKKSRLAPALGLVVLVLGGAATTFLVARQLNKKTVDRRPSTVDSAKPTAGKRPTPNAQPATRRWPTPHALAGETLATDERFPADGLRVQSVRRRDANRVRDVYRGVLAELRRFCAAAELPALRALAARFEVAPLNLVIVPQAMLDTPALWPEQPMSPDSTYPLRYDPAKQTLFVNDTPGFETRDLPYGVASHVLTPIGALTNSDIDRLSEKFEAYYNQKHR